MVLEAQITFSKETTKLWVENLQLSITLMDTTTLPKELHPESLYFLFNEKSLVFIGSQSEVERLDTFSFTEVIEWHTQQEVDKQYLERIFTNAALAAGIALDATPQPVPENVVKQTTELEQATIQIIEKMGYPLVPIVKKKRSVKARHKWTKAVSEVEFSIDTRESIATVMWIKRNQMLIKKGATMMKTAPLNKDGSVGLSAKMGQQLRSEHENQFKEFVTTEDIVLKSVNEVGLFLYFAGTNSWLEMVDASGKTLNEWTIVD